MGRWQPDARDRLEHAALELFVERGFAETTVPQITERAGLTTRTFFRHFADKREVLFAGEQGLPVLIAGLMRDAPPSLAPMALITHGLDAVAATLFEGRFEQVRARRAVIHADEGLRERELGKLSALAETIAQGFRERGVDELTSVVAGRIGVTVVDVAVARWIDLDGSRPIRALFRDTIDAVRAAAAAPCAPELAG